MKVSINPAQRIVIEFDGQEYVCTKPKLGVTLDLEAQLEQAKDSGKGNGTQLIMGHLKGCGLPEEMIRELDADQVQAVMMALQPAKKN